MDEVLTLSMTVAAFFALALALGNRWLRLGLLSRLTERVVFVLLPPLVLIFLVLGTIFIGVATPTEGGAMGAVGALIMAVSRRRLSFDLLKQALDNTAKLSCFVMFILIGATVFSFTFNAADGHLWVEHLFAKLPGGQLGFLIAVNLLVFVLGCFIDFFEIAFIVIPLLVPVADKMGIDLVWFGVIIGMNLQTSFLTPPFGFALFYLRSVAPRIDYNDRVTNQRIPAVTTAQIYKGAIIFITLQVIMLAVVIAFPTLVTNRLDKAPAVSLESIKLEAEKGDYGAKEEDPLKSRAAAGRREGRAAGRRSPRSAGGGPDGGGQAGARTGRQKRNSPGGNPLRRPRHNKKPRDGLHPAGFLIKRDAEAAYSFCACMKSSKPASAKRNHMFCLGAEFDVVVVYLLPAGVLRGQLGIQRLGFLVGGLHDVLREATQLGAAGHQLLQGGGIFHVVVCEHDNVRIRRRRLDHGLVLGGQRFIALDVDVEVGLGAPLPPAGVVVVGRHLVEAQLVVVVGADELDGVDRALLQGRVDLAAGDALRHHAEPLLHLSGDPGGAHLEPLQVGQGLDLLAVPAPHLGAGVPHRKIDDVVALQKLAHQLQAVALEHPGGQLARVEAEGDGRAQGEGVVLAEEIVGRGVAALDGAVLDRVDHAEGGDELAGRVHRDRELAAGHGAHHPGEQLGGADERVERLGEAGGEAPANGGLGMNRRRRDTDAGGEAHAGGEACSGILQK